MSTFKFNQIYLLKPVFFKEQHGLFSTINNVKNTRMTNSDAENNTPRNERSIRSI